MHYPALEKFVDFMLDFGLPPPSTLGPPGGGRDSLGGGLSGNRGMRYAIPQNGATPENEQSLHGAS